MKTAFLKLLAKGVMWVVKNDPDLAVSVLHAGLKRVETVTRHDLPFDQDRDPGDEAQ